jgi:hypothetical protein
MAMVVGAAARAISDRAKMSNDGFMPNFVAAEGTRNFSRGLNHNVPVPAGHGQGALVKPA